MTAKTCVTAPAALAANTALPVNRLAALRQVLDLIAALRQPDQPLTTAPGLHNALARLAQVAEAFGIDGAWLDRLKQVLADPAVFNIVLAIVQYLSGLGGKEQADGSVHIQAAPGAAAIHVDAQSLIDWLPLVVQLLGLLQHIRGGSQS